MSSFQTLSIEYIEHINLKKILRVIIVSSTSTYKLHLLCYKFCIKVFTQQSFLHHITIAKGCVSIIFCDFFLYLNICTSMADLYFSFFCVQLDKNFRIKESFELEIVKHLVLSIVSKMKKDFCLNSSDEFHFSTHVCVCEFYAFSYRSFIYANRKNDHQFMKFL